MDRRQFFRKGLKNAADAALSAANKKVSSKAAHWVRPPFAEPELDFLLNCTRCGDCITACPHHVIFPLSIKRGAEVAATPALDLLNKGCHLCEDWPCMSACQTGALQAPTAPPLENPEEKNSTNHQENRKNHKQEIESTPKLAPPKLANAAIDQQHCLPYQGPECGACRGSCPIPGTLLWHEEKPTINEQSCVGCGLCREACISQPPAITIKTIAIPQRPSPLSQV